MKSEQREMERERERRSLANTVVRPLVFAFGAVELLVPGTHPRATYTKSYSRNLANAR